MNVNHVNKADGINSSVQSHSNRITDLCFLDKVHLKINDYNLSSISAIKSFINNCWIVDLYMHVKLHLNPGPPPLWRWALLKSFLIGIKNRLDLVLTFTSSDCIYLPHYHLISGYPLHTRCSLLASLSLLLFLLARLLPFIHFHWAQHSFSFAVRLPPPAASATSVILSSQHSAFSRLFL